VAWGFEIGRVYNRRTDIHGRLGGQQQGGIITPARYPIVILVTGEEGLEHGYDDRVRGDGVFEYFGEGQTGDMKLRAGNRAIVDHSALGKDLLLFRKAKGGLRFEGEMVCESYHHERAPDGEGAEREAIVFELRPLGAVIEKVEAQPISSDLTLGELRQIALSVATQTVQPASQSKRTIYQRSRDVRIYVLARADGKCEGCGAPAPFQRPDGTP
jgi:5-methylcytosine-specific restriction protein A